MLKKRFCGAALVALTAGFMGVALPTSAGLLTVNCPTVSSLLELNTGLSCPEFDPSNGVLTAIELDLSVAWHNAFSPSDGAAFRFTNSTNATQTGTASLSSEFDPGPLAGFIFPAPLSQPLLTDTETIAAGSGSTTVVNGGFFSNSVTASDSTIFAAYEGLGNFSVPVSTVSTFLVTGDLSVVDLTTAEAGATVTYTFAPSVTIPEPATLALLGTGLAGLGFSRRKKLS